jgi:hypothetical protein
MEPAVFTRHDEIRDVIRCQRPECRAATRFVAAPARGRGDGRRYALLLAVDASGAVQRGEPLRRCPRCGLDFPRFTWEGLKSAIAAAHS